jgi:quercetin dioxygenase-like cupin family protein
MSDRHGAERMSDDHEYGGMSPRSLEEMIAYQGNSVVSRQLVKKDSGNITLFAFERGEGLSEHTAPYDALVLILDGEAEVVIQGRPHRVRQGEMIIMPAGLPHELRAPQRFKMLLVMIRS